jgi:hypothetical protein
VSSENVTPRGDERRKHPRFERPLELTDGQPEQGFAVLETMNVSLGGVLCRVDRFLEPMTRLKVQGRVPGSDQTLRADAVVVRVEPEVEVADRDDYRVALFFQQMGEEDRAVLQDYLEG